MGEVFGRRRGKKTTLLFFTKTRVDNSNATKAFQKILDPPIGQLLMYFLCPPPHGRRRKEVGLWASSEIPVIIIIMKGEGGIQVPSRCPPSPKGKKEGEKVKFPNSDGGGKFSSL